MSDQEAFKKKIKVLFIAKWYLNRYDPQLGVFIRKHASAAARFCDVALLHVHSDAFAEKKYEIVAGHDHGMISAIVYFKKHASSFSLFSKSVNLLRYCRATWKGLNYMKKNFGDHDITHAYILLRPAVIAFLLKLTRKKPFVISEQWSGYATGKYDQKKHFVKRLTRLMTRKAAAVTVVSEFLERHMLRHGLDGNYSVIPNVIEPPALVTTRRNDGTIKILTVADLVDEIKNVSGTFRALAEIFADHPDIEFHLIGEGKDRSMLEKLVSDLRLPGEKIFFYGIRSNEEVYESLLNSDFLIMNSNFETFSLICAEAISCGKPVIATRCGGPEEFVTDETGILVAPRNHQQLVSAIQKMIVEYHNYPEEKLKQYAQDRFSSTTTGRKFLDVYQRILSFHMKN